MATGSEHGAGRVSVAIFSGAAGLALVCDLLTKWAAFRYLEPHVPWRVLPGLLNLRTSRNAGAVFGVGQGLSPLFIVFTIIAAAAIIWAVRVYGPSSRVLTCGLGLLLGGALGNLWDRVAEGSVRDFIDLYVGQYHWPTFNLADAFICIGVGMVIYAEFKAKSTDKTS